MPTITTSIMLPLLFLPLLPSSSAHNHSPFPRDSATRHRNLARATHSRRNGGGLDSNPNLGGFTVVGDSGVSAQMMFLGTSQTVYMLDKTENNSMTVTTPAGVIRPAWGSFYDLDTNTATPMSVMSNTFCAGGMSTGNGSWAVFGGNQPVTYEGVAVNDKVNNPSGANPYSDSDGGTAIRMLTPCDSGDCPWEEGGSALTMTSKRWYPTIEALGDGSLIVLGGDQNGGYVSTFAQNNPSYEYWPTNTGKIPMDFLNATVPLNLFPLTFLMPSGKLFMQAYYSTILYDMNAQQEIALPDMPYAARVYPASAAVAMLPLTPENNYTPTILFCGGSSANFTKSSDGGAGFNVTAVPADDTCVRISPDDPNPQYSDDDSLPEGRSMGNFIYMPDGKLWLGNGVNMGTAGYGDEKYSYGQSYGQDPVYDPVIYDPNAAPGQRFSRQGLSPSNQERMYHSTATLLPDGAILVAGSNPNKDVTTTKWGTSYVVEKFYPLWYSEPRPVPTSDWPENLSYGGEAFNVTYQSSGNNSVSNTKVVVIRPGFSTHCMNFGQRYLELSTTFTSDETSGEVTMHVAQMPSNANIFQPGPALIFLVVDGVPSIGQFITVGSGAIETQEVLAASVLPQSSVIIEGQSNSTGASMTAVAGPSASAATGGQSLHASGGATAGLVVPGTLGIALVSGALLALWS
ncbi:glyoxal oxidase N-terminus-domain-containing protein [Kockovaella imperatae]|uniref:Glyoxal oxidase N-terminus-domain-containing protein n=1 Tax=Kockovaella imperatae TaxID=4999 RepID=A0A1Y1UA51_9TREE|nr:glyoxal oxidase N-terminus-domain-containing protein [Kockovaella imperatae]ORX34898.1 glyoxal oxidase N-terminus-domain-containing protein [Kockovaella imperatae]